MFTSPFLVASTCFNNPGLFMSINGFDALFLLHATHVDKSCAPLEVAGGVVSVRVSSQRGTWIC